jgi:hypothetical protein
LLNYIKSIANKVTQKEQILFLVLLIIYRIICFVNNHDPVYTSDSISYFWEVNFFEGEIHPSRMVVYPFIIYLLSLFETPDYFIIIIIQHILSLFGVIVFYFTLKNLLNNKYLIYITTIVLASWPILLDYNNYIMTESLSVFMMIMLFFINTKLFIYKNTKYIYITLIISFAMMLLKPAFINVYVLNLLFVLYFCSKHIKQLLIISAYVLSSMIFLRFYSSVNCRQNKYHGLSTVTVNNNFANIVNSGAYKNGHDESIKNQIIKKVTDNIYEIVFCIVPQPRRELVKGCPNQVSNIYSNISAGNGLNIGYDRINLFVRQSMLTKEHFKYLWDRLYRMISSYKKILILSFILMVISLKKFFQEKKEPLVMIFIICSIWSNMFVIVVGGIEDWERLLMPSFPLFIILYAFFAQVTIDYFGFNKILQKAKIVSNLIQQSIK